MPSTSSQVREEEEECEIAQRAIIEVEQHKASLQPPKGRLFDSFEFEHFMHEYKLDDNDEFFHVTCHIDSNLKGKIAKGEFIDLEKLLPRSGKIASEGHVANTYCEDKMKLVSRGGHTFFKPVHEAQITELRKWE